MPHNTKLLNLIKKSLDGRSQRWLCKQTGLREDDFSNKINGIKVFRDSDLIKIGKALNISLEEFLQDTVS